MICPVGSSLRGAYIFSPQISLFSNLPKPNPTPTPAPTRMCIPQIWIASFLSYFIDPEENSTREKETTTDVIEKEENKQF